MQAAVGVGVGVGVRCSAPSLRLRRRPFFSPSPSPSPSSRLQLQLQFQFQVPIKRESRSRRQGPEVARCSTSDSYEWAALKRQLAEIDEAERLVALLKLQLQDAIRKEDFAEAASLKASIAQASSKDALAHLLSCLKDAIQDQRYHDASRFSRLAATGLMGWWVAHPKDLHLSFGRLVQITPEFGRYVATSYSPRQLLLKSLGTPLFEIFLLKDPHGHFSIKVVSLQSTRISKKTTKKQLSEQEPGDSSSTEKDGDVLPQDINISEKPEEALLKLVSFLKEKIPSFKVQVLNNSLSDEAKLDMEVVQLEEEEGENADDEQEEEENSEPEQEELEEDDEENEIGEDAGDEIGDLNQGTREIGPDLEKENDKVKLFIGGVLHNREDISNVAYRRVPAEVRCMEKDSFVLHVPRKGFEGAAHVTSDSTSKESDMVKAIFGTSKGDQKNRKTKGIEDFLKFSSFETELRIKKILSEDTIFNRISADTESLDPFTGLYVGSYGPHGPEVVQMRRKYGHWGGSDEVSSGLEFFEYVEAVKLTGDLNVPAGEVTFRAKIGKGKKVSNDGIFPEGLGVTAFYSGQGRTAQRGFKNPQWVQGELLELDGKGMGPIKGAELGFLYLIPDQSFLVLFHRLHLPQ